MRPVAMLAVQRLAGVAPEVNLGNPLCTRKKAHKLGIHPGFETQVRHHQKSKAGVSVAPRRVLVSFKNAKKNCNELLTLLIEVLCD